LWGKRQLKRNEDDGSEGKKVTCQNSTSWTLTETVEVKLHSFLP